MSVSFVWGFLGGAGAVGFAGLVIMFLRLRQEMGATKASNVRLSEGYTLLRGQAEALRQQLADSQAGAEEFRQSAIRASHTSAARASADAIEASLFDLITIRDEAEALIERIKFATNRAAHVRNGGSPDDLKRPRK